MKQLPNLFTLLNLFFGCLAIVMVLQTGLTTSVDVNGQQIVEIPQKIYWASVYIGIAAIIDFIDGFVARLIKGSSEMGKQLDSLADVVSFGVAPGMIVYEFLRLSYASQLNGLDISTIWLLPAFIIPCAGAYRLARFNLDTTQSYGFKGVPIPAAGLLIASFPLIYWFSDLSWVINIDPNFFFSKGIQIHWQPNFLWVNNLLINKFFWYAIIGVVSYLMVSTLPMMAIKFKGVTLKKIIPFIILAVIAVIGGFIIGWLAAPVTFIGYLILSLITYKQSL
jgi:CDP-diacylglycerol--serine O-phosphatidyltransferase